MTSSPSAAGVARTPAAGGSSLERLTAALESTVLGQRNVVADLVTAFLARGHVLLEGVPGVAKTLTARSMASALGLDFSRVQFTPDLMPSDILGTNVFRPQDNAFQLVKGPVFTEVLVADEINRTPPKTQAALLEAMEERQVTIDGTTHVLPAHFFVVATQNPLELEGTYPLPEAQLDRFLMRVRVGYPPPEAELDMVRGFHQREGKVAQVARVLDAATLTELQAQAARVACDESILSYVVKLIRETRANPRVRLGASPRSAQALLAAAKARAALNGSDFVTPDDVKAVCPSVLNHRLILKAEAEVEGLTADDVLRQTLERVQVPR
jgi:MoxR-like ATPase